MTIADRVFLVYTATLPDGSVYVGRTGRTLADRIHAHRRHSSCRTLQRALRDGVPIDWKVIWQGGNYFQSKGIESKTIWDLQQQGCRLLNQTRGGFYDRALMRNGDRCRGAGGRTDEAHRDDDGIRDGSVKSEHSNW